MSALTETTVSFAVPEELRDVDQWLGWRWKVRGGKPTKLPASPKADAEGRNAKIDNREDFMPYEEALDYAASNPDVTGIGFAFTVEDPYSGVDFDGCRDPETGEIHPEVQAVIDRLGSYTEVSPSGTGVKTFLEGSKPGEKCRTRKTPWHENIEIYDKDRFFTLTGQHVGGTLLTVNARQDRLTELYERFFPAREEGERTPRPETVAIEDDEELLEKARAAGGGSGEEFVNLFDKGIAPEGKRSEVDYRLMSKLFFWTGGDVERTIRLFEQSALYRPPPVKHAGYVRLSVEKLLAEYDGDYYDPPRRAREAREAIERRLVPRRQWERWKGLGGQSDRAVYDALLLAGMDDEGYGTLKERGVEIKIAFREIAERAGVSRSTALRSVKRLEERELVERTHAVKSKKQGRILLLFAPKKVEKYFVVSKVVPQADTISLTQGVTTEEVSIGEEESSTPYGASLSEYFAQGEVNLLRLRYGTADDAHLRRLGKGVQPLLEVLLADPHRVRYLGELAQAVDRRKDNVRRSMAKLCNAAHPLVEETGRDLYRLHPDFEANYARELEDSGIVQSERLQREKHAREREAWNTLPEAPAAEPRPPREETEALYNATFHRDAEHAHARVRQACHKKGYVPRFDPVSFREEQNNFLASLPKREAFAARKRSAAKEADVVLLDEYRAARGDVTPGQAREALRAAAREAEKDDGLDAFFDEDDQEETL